MRGKLLLSLGVLALCILQGMANAAENLKESDFPTMTADGKRIIYFIEERKAPKPFFPFSSTDFSKATPYVFTGFYTTSSEALIAVETARRRNGEMIGSIALSGFDYLAKVVPLILPPGARVPNDIPRPPKDGALSTVTVESVTESISSQTVDQ